MRLPSFGYLGGLTIMLLLVPLLMISNALFHPAPSKGFYVHYAQRGMPYAQSEPAPIVYLDQQRRLFINNRPVSREQLQTYLHDALVRRPDHIVYFYADRNLKWEEAVEAMELIKRTNDAEVVFSSSPVPH